MTPKIVFSGMRGLERAAALDRLLGRGFVHLGIQSLGMLA